MPSAAVARLPPTNYTRR